MIIDHLAMGYSKSSFGAIIDVSAERISDWAEKIEDFRESIKIGQSKRLYFWETRFMDMKSNTSIVASIFALKNVDRAEWSDRQELDVPADGGLSAIIRNSNAVSQLGSTSSSNTISEGVKNDGH